MSGRRRVFRESWRTHHGQVHGSARPTSARARRRRPSRRASKVPAAPFEARPRRCAGPPTAVRRRPAPRSRMAWGSASDPSCAGSTHDRLPTWQGRIGLPVAIASQTAPLLACRAGPRGPSSVNAVASTGAHCLDHVPQRTAGVSRTGPARGAVAEPLEDAGNPLPVEVLAGDDDQPGAPEAVHALAGSGRARCPMIGGRSLAAGGLEMGPSFDTPSQCRSRARRSGGAPPRR